MLYKAYIGTNAVDGSRGIYQVSFSGDNDLTVTGTAEGFNSGYLTMSSDERFLYAVRENMVFHGRPCGGVGAYALTEGGPVPLNEEPIAGQLPCYLSTDAAGRYVFIASYLTGCVSVHRILADGSIGPVFKVLQHKPEFGIFPSVHCVRVTPDQKYICALDVTVHRIVFYDLEHETFEPVFTLQLPPPYTRRPRQAAFSAHHAYVLTETGHGLLTFSYRPEETDRILKQEQSFDLTPADYEGITTGACIKLSPDGKMLVCSVRRAHLLTTFKVAEDGTLSEEAHIKMKGLCPRDFNFTPDGKYLLVCAQQSNALELYAADTENHTLRYCSTLAGVPNGTCVCFGGSR